MNKKAFFITLLTISTQISFAQTLDDMTIHADKTGVPLHLSNLNVEIIEISRTDTDLEEALLSSSSVNISNVHGQDGTAVTLNGMSNQHVLVTLDGLAINPSGVTVNLNDINLANIQRIEIIKGNASSQYGSKAMGGVINLVSKPVKEKSLPSASIKNSRHAQHQSLFGDSVFKINHSQGFGEFKFSHNLQINSYSESKLDKDSLDAQSSRGFRILIDEKMSKDALSIHSLINLKRLERAYSESLPGKIIEKNKMENEDRASLQLNYSPKRFKTSAKYQFFQTQSIQDALVTENLDFTRELNSHFFQANIDSNYDLNNHSFTYGAFAHYEYLNQFTTDKKEIDEETKNSLELFVLHDWYATDAINIQSGLRTQYDSAFGLFNSPNIIARWDVNANHVIKASTGIGYRVPNLKERFYEFDHSHIGYILTGNDSLEPETSFSNQIQWSFQNHNFSFEHSFYANYLDQLIELQESGSVDGVTNYTYVNHEKGQVFGMDSQIKFTTEQNLELSLGSNFLKAYYLDQDSEIIGNQINKPNTNIRSSAKWNLANNKSLSADISWQSDAVTLNEENDEVALPDVFVINMSWQQQLQNDLSIQLDLNNLTNTIQDSTILGDPRPSSGFELAINLSYHP